MSKHSELHFYPDAADVALKVRRNMGEIGGGRRKLELVLNYMFWFEKRFTPTFEKGKIFISQSKTGSLHQIFKRQKRVYLFGRVPMSSLEFLRVLTVP